MYHLVFVFPDNAQSSQKKKHNDEQVEIVSLQHPYQVLDNVSFHHFSLDLDFFSQIQKNRECNIKKFILFRNHYVQRPQLLIVVFLFLIQLNKLWITNIEFVYLIGNYSKSRVSNLVLH